MDNQDPVILARSLVKQYEDRTVVDGIDLKVERGEVFGLLGPNGSGKTTTVEMIAGLRHPTSGEVKVMGLDPSTQRDKLTKLVSVQPQAASLFPTLTVIETMQLFASFYKNSRTADEVIKLTGLHQCKDIRVKKLSGGQARRLLIGLAVIGRPKLLILDEPAAGLDPMARREFWHLIHSLREEAVTVLLTTHHMDEAIELCDRLAIMVSGRIVAEGTPSQLIDEYSSTWRVQFTIPESTQPEAVTKVSAGNEVKITPLVGALLVQIDTADPDALLRRITFHRGLHATGIRVVEASLEDVFLKLAGEPEQKWAQAEEQNQTHLDSK